MESGGENRKNKSFGLVLHFLRENITKTRGAQCGNLVIFLPMRFYVKSYFGDFGDSKSAILTVLAPLNLGFGEFLQFLKLKFAKKKSEFRFS